MNRFFDIGKQHNEVFQGTIAKNIPYHRMYGKEYCITSLTLYDKKEVQTIRSAAEGVDRIYWKVLRFVQRNLPDSFLKKHLGIHPALIQAARIETPVHGVSRQDWIINPSGMKCIENNTDTPTGIPETAYLANELVNRYTSLSSTSSGMRTAIQAAFSRLIEHYRSNGLNGMIAFSCCGEHLEDRTNTEYVRAAVKDLGYRTQYVPLDELQIIPDDGLYANGERISILYRLYPLEYLILDTDEETGEKIGEALLSLVVQGKLGLINPPQSIITQSKGFMALIWSLYERRNETQEFCGFTLFTKEDIEVIEKYLLPTYFEDTVFVQSGIPFVSKGYWGREGKGTSLFDESGVLQESEWGYDEAEAYDIRAYYDNQPKIYQQQFSLHEVTIQTEEGPYKGFLLTGAYIIGGTFSGLLPRIGSRITGDMAYYSAAATKK